MNFESFIELAHVNDLFRAIPPEKRYQIYANEPILYKHFYEGATGPIRGLPSFAKETYKNLKESMKTPARRLAMKEGIPYASSKEALNFIDLAVNNPQKITRGTTNKLFSQLMSGQFNLNMQTGRWSSLLDMAMAGQYDVFASGESFIKSLPKESQELARQSIKNWGKKPTDMVVALKDYLKFTQLNSAFTLPTNQVLSAAANEGIPISSLKEFNDFVDYRGSGRWGSDKIQKLKNLAHETALIKDGKLLGFTGGGGSKPFLLTGGTNPFVSAEKIGGQILGTTDDFNLFGMRGGSKKKIITAAQETFAGQVPGESKFKRVSNPTKKTIPSNRLYFGGSGHGGRTLRQQLAAIDDPNAIKAVAKGLVKGGMRSTNAIKSALPLLKVAGYAAPLVLIGILASQIGKNKQGV